MAADAVLRIRDAPNADEPLVQAERRIFKDGPDLSGKLFAATLRFALEHAAGFDLADVIAAALRADNLAIGPLNVDHVFMANVQIREVANGFKKGLRVGVLLCHAPILPERA